MVPTFLTFKISPNTSWVAGFRPIWRHSSCCEKDIIIIWGCDLDTCLFQMGKMMEGRVPVEVSCGRNGVVLTAEKWLWEHTIGGKRDRLGPMKQADIFTLVGKADFFFSLSREKQNSGSFTLINSNEGKEFHTIPPQLAVWPISEVKRSIYSLQTLPHYPKSQHQRCTSGCPCSPSCHYCFYVLLKISCHKYNFSRHITDAPRQLCRWFSLNSYPVRFLFPAGLHYVFMKWKYFHKLPHSMFQFQFASLSCVNKRNVLAPGLVVLLHS